MAYRADRIAGVFAAEGALLRGQALTKGTSADQLTAPGAAKGFVLAVATQDHKDKDTVDAVAVAQGTLLECRAAGAIAKGAEIMCDANGKFVTAAGAGFVIGWAKEAATAADEIIEVVGTAYWRNS